MKYGKKYKLENSYYIVFFNIDDIVYDLDSSDFFKLGFGKPFYDIIMYGLYPLYESTKHYEVTARYTALKQVSPLELVLNGICSSSPRAIVEYKNDKD